LHLTALVVVPGFLALGWWQLHRALSGNALSWAYAFEWPFFAAYAVYLWWKLVHEQPEPVADAGGEGPPAGSREGLEDEKADEEAKAHEEDDELAAYNRYLAELSAADDRKRR
jgi:DNA-binding transcriptional regulator of glucitol operon